MLDIVVRGHSMEASFAEGSRIHISSLAMGRSPVARRDVVVLRSPVVPEHLELKRIIGLPGEEVSWSAGPFSVNGVPLDEPYARIPPAPPGDDELHTVRLGPNEYFVAGDNRLYSRDSRQYGPISHACLLAKLVPFPKRL